MLTKGPVYIILVYRHVPVTWNIGLLIILFVYMESSIPPRLPGHRGIPNNFRNFDAVNLFESKLVFVLLSRIPYYRYAFYISIHIKFSQCYCEHLSQLVFSASRTQPGRL